MGLVLSLILSVPDIKGMAAGVAMTVVIRTVTMRTVVTVPPAAIAVPVVVPAMIIGAFPTTVAARQWSFWGNLNWHLTGRFLCHVIEEGRNQVGRVVAL